MRVLLRVAAVTWLMSGCGSSGTPSGPGAEGGVDGPPRVLDSVPGEGVTVSEQLPLVNVEFSRPMDPDTFRYTASPQLLTLRPTWDGRFVELHPEGFGSLAPGVEYTFTFTGTDTSGSSLSHTLHFKTAPSARDTTAPTLSTSPANGATGVPLDAPLVLTFSEPVDPDLVEVALVYGYTGVFAWNETYDRLTVQPPTGGWIPGMTPKVTVKAWDLAGNRMPPYELSFTAAVPASACEVLGMSPPPGSTTLLTNGWLSFSFSHDMAPASVQGAVSLSGGVTCGVWEWVNPRMGRCRPQYNGFTAGTPYTVTVGTSARDVSGTPLASVYQSTFTATETRESVAPTIVSTLPANGATAVAADTSLRVTFSEPMDRGTVEKHFRHVMGTPRAFRWNTDSTEVTAFPTDYAYQGLKVQWTLDSSEDLSGNSIYESTTWRTYETVPSLTRSLFPKRSVALGTEGSRTEKLGVLRVGDNARNEGSQAFLTFDLADLPADAPASTAKLGAAYLVLRRQACEGAPLSALGGALLVEGVDVGDTVDAADLQAPALPGQSFRVDNACSAAPATLVVPVTEKVRADLAAAGQKGTRLHFRIRYPTPTNGDGKPDRFLLAPYMLSAIELKLAYESKP